MVVERVALGVEAAASIHRRLFLVHMELQGIVVGVERQCPPQGWYKINVVVVVIGGLWQWDSYRGTLREVERVRTEASGRRIRSSLVDDSQGHGRS